MKHKSYRGKVVDMELLRFQHEHAVAAGNASMNARGDILGRGGVIKKTREELLQEREMVKRDVIPEHQSRSIVPKVEVPVSDVAFFAEVQPEVQEPSTDSTEDVAGTTRRPRKK